MRVPLAVLLLGAAACSGAIPTPVDTTAERFDTAEAEAARERAPDMFAAAERARVEAIRARRRGDLRAARDHATRARLLLAAAVSEADRLALEERRLELEERARQLEEQAARDVRARLALQAEMGRRVAARVAARQAALAFEQAAEEEARRYRAQADERARMYREAADILLHRAELLSSAARALGADATRISQVTDLIEETQRENDPARRLQRAQDAVGGALVALGEARASRDGPTADEAAALRETATQMGFEVEQRDRGLTVRVEDVFGGRGSRPLPARRARLEQLAALLAAHPHGPVQVHAFGAGRAARRLADARASALAESLARHGVTRDRLLPEGIVDDDGSRDAEVVFVAYGASDRPADQPR